MRAWKVLVVAVGTVAENAAALLYAAMMVIAFTQVFYRYVLGSPLTWTEEIARYAFVWLVFLGAAVTLLRTGQDGHIALTFLVDRLGARARFWLGALVHLAIGYVALHLMLWEGHKLALRTMAQTSPATGLPIGWAYMAIPIAGVVMLLIQLYRLLEFLRALRRGRPEVQVYERLSGPGGGAP
jgi:TRAP-type transport system small permease protein